MTWVYLSVKERNRISHTSGPFIANSFAPHEAEVKRLNPRDNWVGLTDDERDTIRATFVTGNVFYVKNLLAAFEEKLKEKNT